MSMQIHLKYYYFSLKQLLLQLSFVSILCLELHAQTVPAGMPVLDESIRRAQLLGKVDEGLSLMIRPVSPRKALGVNDAYKFDKGYFANDSVKSPSVLSFFKNKGRMQLLPAVSHLQHNSSSPYGWGDGPIIPARGFQQMLAAGVYAEAGPLSIQFRPEFVWSQNKDFERFPQSYSDQIWADRYDFWIRSDDPEKFGEGSYTKTNLGQTSIKLNVGPMSFGASNENIWWGPGQFNSIIFSNNSEGFKHLTLHTRKPIKTYIGFFEAQLLSGRLEG